MHAIHKIIAKKAGVDKVEVGQTVNVKVDLAMMHDRTGYKVVKRLEEIGIKKITSDCRTVIIYDHEVPPSSIASADRQKNLWEYMSEQAIVHNEGVGICHQVMVDHGYVRPGQLLVGADSHTSTTGVLGNLAISLGITDMAWVLVKGTTWLRVPPVILFNINGTLPFGLMAKDVILKIISQVGAEACQYKAAEFWGDFVKAASMDARMCLANMATEMGAKATFMRIDGKTLDYLHNLDDFNEHELEENTFLTDKDFKYERQVNLDVSNLEPQVACPHKVTNVKPVRHVAGTEIHQGFIGTCTSGRIEDLRMAAKVLRGNKLKKGVRLLIVPGSQKVYLQALKEGLLETLVKAKATVLNPNCASCGVSHMGLLAAGEVSISAGSRNSKGRRGSFDSDVYLASPAVVAASCIKGEIADPREFLERRCGHERQNQG